MDVNEFQHIGYSAETLTVFVRVNEKTENIEEEDVKNAQIEILNWAKKHQTSFLLINVRELRYSVSPALQDWVNQIIIPQLFDCGVTKIAYIMPTEFFEKLSIEQLGEDVQEKVETERIEFGVDFFDNEQEAITWFSSKYSQPQKKEI